MINKKIIENYIKENDYLKDTDTYCYEKIKAAEKIRIEINKSNDLLKMLDLSLLCIYYLIGDEAFYKTNRNKIIEFICNYEKR